MSRQILQPPGWARAKGFSNGIAAKGNYDELCLGPKAWCAI
jgi:hypothetical protein